VPPSLKDMKKIRRQTVWHLLLRGHLPVEGFSSSELLLHLVQAVHRTNARLVGEIGFNTGLSSHAFLTANPDVHVVSFDLNKHGCVKVAKKLIDKKFSGRHTLIYGDSRTTVPAFKAQNPNAYFDVVFIDGGHRYEVAKADILNMKPLSTDKTVILLDDLVPWTRYGRGPHRAWTEALADGIAHQDELFQDRKRVEVAKPPGLRCWALGRYIFLVAAVVPRHTVV
jgi:predicted O-methyltransferase YrrM